MPAELETPAASPAPSPAAAAAPAPAPAAAATAPKGTDSLMADMDAVINPKAPEPPPAPPTPKGKTTPPRNDQGKFTPAPAKSPEDAPGKDKDPVALRKRLTELETETKQLREQRQTEIGSLQAKIAEMEKRKFLTPEQEKQQADREKRLAQLESEAYAQDYSKSPEFETKFKGAWNKKYAEAARAVQSLTVQTEDERTRPATVADWQRVLNAPSGLEARRIAKELFGEDTDARQEVLDHRNALKGIEDQANLEIENRRNTWNQTKSQWETQQKGMAEQWQTHRNVFDQAIKEKYPEFFGDDPAHPELTEQLTKGLAFVDDSLKNAEALPPDQHAMRSSLIRMWAGAFPRLVAQIRVLKSESEAKDAELAKYRKSDPGGGGDIGGGGEKQKGKGTDDLAAEFANV